MKKMKLHSRLYVTIVIYAGTTLSDSTNIDSSLCPPWFIFNTSTGTCQYYKQSYLKEAICCTNNGTLLEVGFCMTYMKGVGTYMAQCPYFDIRAYNIVYMVYIQLPHNKTELSDYMCGPMNRRSTVCRKCVDGFRPSLTSIGYKCYNCTDVWYGIPLYLFVEVVPLTVLFIIILSFRLSLTSASMTCFIVCSQFVLYEMLTKYSQLQRERIIVQTRAPGL